MSHDFSLVLYKSLILFEINEKQVRMSACFYDNVSFAIGSLSFYSSKHLSFPSFPSDWKAFLLKLLIFLLVSFSNFPLRTSLTRKFLINHKYLKKIELTEWGVIALSFVMFRCRDLFIASHSKISDKVAPIAGNIQTAFRCPFMQWIQFLQQGAFIDT